MYTLTPGADDTRPPSSWARKEVKFRLGRGEKSLSNIVEELAKKEEFCWLVFEDAEWALLEDTMATFAPSQFRLAKEILDFCFSKVLQVDALCIPLSLTGRLVPPEAEFVHAVRICGSPGH